MMRKSVTILLISLVSCLSAFAYTGKDFAGTWTRQMQKVILNVKVNIITTLEIHEDSSFIQYCEGTIELPDKSAEISGSMKGTISLTSPNTLKLLLNDEGEGINVVNNGISDLWMKLIRKNIDKEIDKERGEGADFEIIEKGEDYFIVREINGKKDKRTFTRKK